MPAIPTALRSFRDMNAGRLVATDRVVLQMRQLRTGTTIAPYTRTAGNSITDRQLDMAMEAFRKLGRDPGAARPRRTI